MRTTNRAQARRAAMKIADWLFTFNVDLTENDEHLDAIITDAVDRWFASDCTPEDAARAAVAAHRAAAA